MVTMRSPGDTVEVDFSFDPTMVPSLATSVLVEAEADCFRELGVMVEVEADLDELEGVRWVSLSSVTRVSSNRLQMGFRP